jgi:GTP cyclohydrolase I
MIDQERIAKAVREILLAIGEDPRRDGVRETPRRVAEMYAELFAGADRDPRDDLAVGFEEGHQELVIVRDLPFASLCEHHLLPFFGTAHLGYVPVGRVVGVSKLARALETLSHRPQMQERLTNQIADLLQETLQPTGVAVVLQAEHLCMTIRGVRSPGSRMVTAAHRGCFQDDPQTRAEFLALVGKGAA